MEQDQAYYDNLYLQQVQQYEMDRRLNNGVALLQGLAALFVIVLAIRTLMQRK